MAQAEEKQRNMYEQALRDKEEFEKMLSAQKNAKEKDRKILEEKEIRVKEYRELLQKQMLVNQDIRKQNKRDSMEEGRLIAKKIENEKETIRRKQLEKVQMLETEKIDMKFTAKLKTMKFV